jgi:hypothetical protein
LLPHNPAKYARSSSLPNGNYQNKLDANRKVAQNKKQTFFEKCQKKGYYKKMLLEQMLLKQMFQEAELFDQILF